MKPQNIYHKTYLSLILGLVIVVGFAGCKSPIADDAIDTDGVEINILTPRFNVKSESGITINSLRIIAIPESSQDVMMNKSSHNGGLRHKPGKPGDGSTSVADTLSTIMKPGSYTLYVIGNETTEMTSAVSNAWTRQNVDDVIMSSENLNESNSMLYCSRNIVVRSAGNGDGNISTDGGVTWVSDMGIELEWMSVKVSVSIRKDTPDPSDHFVITKIQLSNIPIYSFVVSKPYDGYERDDKIIYEDVAGTPFTNNMQTGLFQDVGTAIVIPEYILLEEDNVATSAMILKIFATYNGIDVVYTVPIKSATAFATEDYNLYRNNHYNIRTTITQSGTVIPKAAPPLYTYFAGANVVISDFHEKNR